MRVTARLLGVVAILGLTLAQSHAVLAAQAPDPTAGCSGSWASPNGTGEALVVDCSPGFASNHDRILIYPRSGAETGADWRTALNMTDAVWLFNVGAGLRTNLLIDFHPNHAGPGVAADLYDDQSGSGQVSYRLSNGIPVPTSPVPSPTVRVVAPDGWWLKDGLINYNLDITVDGPVQTGWQSDIYLKQLQTDGRPDFRVTVRDDQHRGRPDWELVRALPPLADADAVTRSALMVSTLGDQPIQGYVFWPFLSPSVWGLVQDYNLREPPIQVDWQTGRVGFIGEFVASRGAPANWFIYSNSPFGINEGTYADFENPFAFYDLAGKNDGYPDMAIRQQYAGAHDSFRGEGQIDQPFNFVRYSWDQYHRHLWDYKVDLAGRHQIDGRVTIGPLVVDTTPYRDLPGWMISRSWDAVAFVAGEQAVRWTSEGLYASPLALDRFDHYLSGEDPRPLGQSGWGIEEGFRTDYRAAPGSKPDLYFSSIDHKLHLQQAQGGIWNLGNGRDLGYLNLGGDFINRWELRSQGKVQEALSFLDGQLIYETSGGVSIRPAAADPAVFTSLPPSDNQSWAQLGGLLEANKAGFEGTDLAAMFGQFSTASQLLTGARLWDLQMTPTGFSFSLQLTQTPSAGGPWRGLQPGRYFVQYSSGGGYAVSPFAPGTLDFSSLQVSGNRPVALQAVEATLMVSNSGTETAGGAQLRFVVTEAGRSATPVGPVQQLEVPGGGSRQLAVSWVPPRPGEWKIQADVTDGTGTKTAGNATVQVLPSPPSNLFGLLAASHLGVRVLAPIAALLATLLMTGFVAFTCPRPFDRQDAPAADADDSVTGG